MLSTKLFFCIVVVITGTLSLHFTDAQASCGVAVGDYRNCTCGVQYRIVERRCCDDDECFLPEIITENLTCPFVCENGGTFDSAKNGCNCKDGYYGLCCEQETKLCGAVYVNSSGEFTSLHFPREYPNNVRCVWRISTDPVRRIALGTKNREFTLESGTNPYSCNTDYLRVLDGPVVGSPQLDIFCGTSNFRNTFHTVYSKDTPHMYVEFQSDYSDRAKGFHLQYSVFFAGQECGPVQTYTKMKGTITSPQHPIEYRPREDCKWTIVIEPGHDVILSADQMELPATNDCKWGDRLQVSGRLGNQLIPVTTLCGYDPIEPQRITGGYSELILQFRSDRSCEGKGFVLEYKQVPAVTLTSALPLSNLKDMRADKENRKTQSKFNRRKP